MYLAIIGEEVPNRKWWCWCYCLAGLPLHALTVDQCAPHHPVVELLGEQDFILLGYSSSVKSSLLTPAIYQITECVAFIDIVAWHAVIWAVLGHIRILIDGCLSWWKIELVSNMHHVEDRGPSFLQWRILRASWDKSILPLFISLIGMRDLIIRPLC